MQRRIFMRRAAALAAAAALPSRGAESFPTHPLTLLVAFAPGGVGDIVARSVANEASTRLGQTIVIQNRPIPTAAPTTVARASPDGYTMMLTGNGTTITQALFEHLSFDLLRDFRHVTTLALFDLALLTGAASRFKGVGDAVAYARANPGKLNMATVRVGSTQNLAAELFKSAAGIDAVIVPYKATGDVVAALRTGDADVAVEIVPPLLGMLKANTVRPLAVLSARRFTGLPQVPTLIESGFAGFEVTSWNGISVPAATPQPVVEKLGAAFRDAIASPKIQSDLAAMGITPQAGSSVEMTERIRADIKRWQAVIEKARIPRQ